MPDLGSESYDRWDLEERHAMEAVDHYPHSTTPTASSLQTPPPVIAPAQRFRLRFGVMECTICGYAKEFCGCAKRAKPDAPSADDARAESNLSQRARECQGSK